jgi:hypothetical protein
VQCFPQQIALALSENNKPLTVQGFYTLAMGMHLEAHSPVFMGKSPPSLTYLSAVRKCLSAFTCLSA